MKVLWNVWCIAACLALVLLAGPSPRASAQTASTRKGKGDGGEQELEGKRKPPPLVGNWAVSYLGDRVTLALAIRLNKKGKLTAHWQTPDGDLPVKDFRYEEGKLTFTSRYGSYSGRLKNRNLLDGALKASGGETPVAAFRMGLPIIGTWDLEVTSEGGTREQRLKVLPDMSGWYGAIPIKKVHLDGESPLRKDPGPRAVKFRAAGKSALEMSFVGRVAGSKLTGEITTSSGRAKVAGRKVARASGE